MSLADLSGEAAAAPARAPRRADHPTAFRNGRPGRPSMMPRYRLWLELAVSLGWGAAEIASACGVATAAVSRGLALARAAGPGDEARPDGPPAGGSRGPRSRLTPAELRYIREAYGDDPDVRRWLLEAGLV